MFLTEAAPRVLAHSDRSRNLDRSARTDRSRHLMSSERGSALLGVIVVMAVMLVVSATVTGVTVYSLGVTSATRAAVQSVAAAESGVNVAEVSLKQGACLPRYDGAVPKYSARLSYSLDSAADVWVEGCPTGGVAALRIKVVSTGAAVSTGVNGNTRGDVSTVESIFGYVSEVLPGIQPTGAAMYLHGGVVFENNANLLVAESGRAAIQVKQGDMSCSSNTVIEGDVVVSQGDLDIRGCAIEGNAWASGAAQLGQVTGNLTSASVNLSAAELPGRVGGVYTRFTASTQIPHVPDWVDLAYVPGDWIDTAGAPYKVTSIDSTCTISATMLAAARNGSKPVIIDATALCPLGVTASGNVNLTNDVVIFAQQFDFVNNVNFRSSTTAPHKVWFITPDSVPDAQPTCSPGLGDFSMKNSFTVADTVSAMLYTPCRLEAKNSFNWQGQLYANGANDFKNNTSFVSVPMGLPGIDLDTGTVVTGGSVGSDAELGLRTSSRDLLISD